MEKFIIAVVVVAVLIIIWGILSSNKFEKQKVDVSEALSGIDVALEKRYDLLTKELDIVKGYAQHEVDTLEKVTQYRAGMSMHEKNQMNQQLTSALSGIQLIAENYPNLRSSKNFQSLQETTADVEEHLQAARRVYNTTVTALNKRVRAFPSNLIAALKGIKQEEFFEVSDPKKRNDVKMEF